jgi:glycine oxidase
MQEVVVVGGGIAGSAVALELREQGAAVNLVDAARPGAAATGASAGMLAPQYESSGRSPLFDLLVRARSFFAGFAESVQELSRQRIAVRWDGMLVANRSAEEHAGAEAAVAWQRAAGQPAELLGADRACQLQPGLDPAVASWVWLPGEGQADSQQLAAALPDALAAAGVRVIAGRRVAELVARGGRVAGVRLEDGRVLVADAVVLAAGAWSGSIGGLPRPLPVRPVRGHLLRFPGGGVDVRPILALHEGRYLVPRDDGTLLAGSTMDDVGFDRSLSEEGMATVRRAAATLLPALGNVEPMERWADLRPIMADGLPVLGPDPDLEGLLYATGYGRNGILLGPLAGRIVADLLMGRDPDEDWRPFAPDRLPAGPA